MQPLSNSHRKSFFMQPVSMIGIPDHAATVEILQRWQEMTRLGYQRIYSEDFPAI
jgi:hypothetical protein